MLVFIFGLLSLVTIIELVFSVVFAQLFLQRRKLIYLYFSIFTGIAIFWSIGTVLILFGRTTPGVFIGYWLWYIAPMISTLFILFFCQQFINDKVNRLYSLGVLVLIAYAGVLALNGNLITIGFAENGINAIYPNKLLYLFYIAFFTIYFDISIFILKRHRKNRDQIKYLQARNIVYGTGLTGFLGIITNLVLPVFGKTDLVWVGPVLSMFFLAFSGLAITRYRLFDIKGTILRSTSYLFAVAFMLMLLTLIFSGVFGRTFLYENLTFRQWIPLSIIMAVFGVLFGPLQRYFNKLSNKLFYRDSYDSSGLLNELNASLVVSTGVEEIMKNSINIIDDSLKPTYAAFDLYHTQEGKERVTISKNNVVSEAGQKHMIELIKQFSHGVTTVSGNDDIKSTLKTAAVKENIELVAQLAPSDGKDMGVGAIVLGPKKSGGIYNSQDITVMKIIADELVIAIQNALRFEEIQQFNLTLQKKVDEATRKLRSANEKLIALDQTKDDFISMASHQLRTPLTSIKGYVSMVIEGDVGKITPQQRKLLGQAFLSSQRMVYLIADLLNVSRLKTGKFVIDSKPTNLADLVEGELSQLTETAKQRELELKYDKPKNIPLLMLDETKIRQVVMNFVDNALYYTPAGGRVVVETTLSGNNINFTVTDNGIGVPKKEQHNLFSKFYRAKNAKKARPDGTGLGLYMAKKVIIAQGGTIIFRTKQGSGSTFGFSFNKNKLQLTDEGKASKHKLDK